MKRTKNHFFFSILSIIVAMVLLYACDTIQKEDAVPAVFSSIKANGDEFSTVRNTPISLSFLSNDRIGENTSVKISNPLHGSVKRASGGFVYYPDPSYTGEDSFSYVICQGTECDSGIVVIVINPNDSTDTTDTTGINDTCRVVAEYDVYQAYSNDSVSSDSATYIIDVLANDTICNLQSFTITKNPISGDAIIGANKIYYTTRSPISVYDTLKYRICSQINGQLKCSETFVNINILK